MELTMKGYRVISVKEFNKLANDRYYEAIRRWREKGGSYPFIGFYLFWDSANGEPIQSGYVATNDDNIHCYGSTRQEAISKFEEV